MPPLLIRCSCGKVIPVAAQHRGRQVKCLRCARTMQVPERIAPTEAWLNGARLIGERARSVVAALVAQMRPLDARSYGRTEAAHRRILLLVRLSWGYLALAFLLCLTLWGLGDAWWPATILLFSGRWVFLLPLGVLVPAALVIWRPLVAPLALAGILVLGPVMGFRTGWRRAIPHAAGQHVRVVTFNLNDEPHFVAELPLLLAAWEPDLVALQECGTAITEATHRLKGWYHHNVSQLCFLSRWPILDSLVMDRSVLERVRQDESTRIGGSGDVARYRVQTPQGVVSITNLHLETPRKGLEDLVAGTFNLARLRGNTELRSLESRLARRWVGEGAPPTLVAGDFNTPVESRIFQRSWGDFTDAFSHAGFGLGMTKQNGWISVRIDHVLTGPGWYVDRAGLGAAAGSDHRPVIVDLTLVGAVRGGVR